MGFIFKFYLLMLIADVCAGYITAALLFRMHRRFLNYFGMAFIGMATLSLYMVLMAGINGPAPRIIPWQIVSALTIIAFKVTTMGALTLKLIGLKNGDMNH